MDKAENTVSLFAEAEEPSGTPSSYYLGELHHTQRQRDIFAIDRGLVCPEKQQ